MSILNRLTNIRPQRFIDFTKGQIPPDFSLQRNSPVFALSKNNKLEYVPSNIPAFGYKNGECLGLQISAATTNICKQAIPDSNIDFYDGTQDKWTKTSGIDASQSEQLAPDGTNTALLVTRNSENLESSYKYIRYYFSSVLTDGTVRTFSFYVKPGSVNKVEGLISNDSVATHRVIVVFELTGNGRVVTISKTNNNISTNETAGIENIGNGWYRCWITTGFKADAIYQRNNSLIVYPGVRNAQNAGDSIHFWGAQLEEGFHPNPLVITSGSEVTAGGDNVSTLDSFSYGTILISLHNPSAPFDPSETSFLGYGDQTTQVRLSSGQAMGGTSYLARGRVRRGNIDNVVLPLYTSLEVDVVSAMSVSPNRTEVAYGNKVIGQDYVDSAEGIVTGLRIGSWTNTPRISLSGYIRKIALFSQAMTGDELTDLTRIYSAKSDQS